MYFNVKDNDKVAGNAQNQQKKDYLHLFTEEIKNQYLEKQGAVKRIYAVMLFNSEFELGISANPNKWVNTRNIITVDGAQALDLYANIPNPASQLIDAESIEELNEKMVEMNNNFQNQDWLNELYEYL